MEHNLANNKEHVRSVKTFVLFDTETTGLPSPRNNPRITELCFIALTREELLTQQTTSRVLNKLLICFNPCKNICPRSSNITGLYNDALEAMAPFRNQALLISMFLRNLPQPACLIAHNGNGFDFPLLVSHLKYANEEVPDGILCADSLEAFRMFDGLPPVPEYAIPKRRTNLARPSPLTKGIHMINEASGNMINEASGNMSLELPKRCADSDSLVSQDIKCKQAKLSIHQVEVWDNCEHTPTKSSLHTPTKSSLHTPTKSSLHTPTKSSLHTPTKSSGISHSIRPQPKTHSSVDQYENRSEVKRQLFESECENREHIASLQSKSDDNLICIKEGAECYHNTLEENNIIDEFSIRGVNMGKSSDFERDMSQLCTKTEIFDNLSKNREEAIPSCKNAAIQKTGCSQIESDVCSPSHQNGRDAFKSPSQIKRYGLSEVYSRLFGHKPEASHNAEDDCLTLLKIIHFEINRFSAWCDRHAVLLKSIHPMY